MKCYIEATFDFSILTEKERRKLEEHVKVMNILWDMYDDYQLKNIINKMLEEGLNNHNIRYKRFLTEIIVDEDMEKEEDLRYVIDLINVSNMLKQAVKIDKKEDFAYIMYIFKKLIKNKDYNIKYFKILGIINFHLHIM